MLSNLVVIKNEKPVRYVLLVSREYIEDFGSVISYGIKSINSKDNVNIKNIYIDKNKAIEFVNLCNKHHVSPIIIEDVLEDFI